MHQQIPHLEQCGMPSQMAQPIILCPIQLVYDGQTYTQMVVQNNEDHIQRPQPMLLNVQKTPPWIQNQTQNVIYIQQTPNQMLPYSQPNMIQNPIFQTPYNFPQIIPQEPIRPVMQMPTIIQKDTIQNQTANFNYPGTPALHENMTQNPMANINFHRATEKMPFVDQNQVNTALKAEIMQLHRFNDIVGTETIPNEATLNNQVNTTIKSGMNPTVAENRINTIANAEMMPITVQSQRKPEKMPILTNLLNQNPTEYENKPITQNQHVQTDFSIAKTSTNTNTVATERPQYDSTNNASQINEKQKEIPQLNPINARLPYHKTSNLHDQRHTRPIRPNVSKNVDVPLHIKSKLHETINVRAIYRPILPRPVVRPYEFKGPNFINPNFVTLRAPNPMKAMPLPYCGVITNNTMTNQNINTINANKNNDKATEIHNITPTNGGPIINNNVNNKQDTNVQYFEKPIGNAVPFQPTDKVEENKPNIIRNEEISVKGYGLNKEYLNKKEKTENKELHSDLKPIIQTNINETQSHIKEEKYNVEQKQEKLGQETKKEINLDDKISTVNRNNEEKSLKDGIFILTHVLDGHVIQESNVAFPIYKPVKEKVTHEPYKNEPDWKNEDEPLLPLKYLHIIDNDNRDGENNILEMKDNKDTDNPFTHLTKSAVEAWNMDQLSSHLTKCNWKETAIKLKEQEIDGESLLLVSEQQLVNIGVSEKHAELISEFVNKCAEV